MNNSWIDNRKAYTYEQLSELLGCVPLTARHLCERNHYTILKGTRGRNGKPALILLSDENLKALYQEGVNLMKNSYGICGRKWENFASCKMSRELLMSDNNQSINNKPQYDIHFQDFRYIKGVSEYVLINNEVLKIHSINLDSAYIVFSSIIGNGFVKYDIIGNTMAPVVRFVEIRNSKKEWIKFSKHPRHTEEEIMKTYCPFMEVVELE